MNGFQHEKRQKNLLNLKDNMKRENIAIVLALASFIFWVGENIYFGWNSTALSSVEAFCDGLAIFGMFMAFLIKPSSNTIEYHIVTGGPVNFANDLNDIKKKA